MPFTAPICRLASAAFAMGLLLPGAAGAISIALDPAAQSVEVGDAVSVDVVFSGLGGEVVSAYDLDVTYDPGVLAATDVVFTTQLGDELFFEAFNGFDLSAPGLVDLAQLSFLTDDELFALQGGDTVTVATLEFQAVANGTTALDFVFDAFNDVKGRDAAVLPLDATPASVEVGMPPSEVPIPEPGAALVFGIGSLLVGGAVRRSHRSC